jgi:hypothetical protein
VLSTLHTNSAVGAVTRLQDMGVAPFLIASSLSGCAGAAFGAPDLSGIVVNLSTLTALNTKTL